MDTANWNMRLCLHSLEWQPILRWINHVVFARSERLPECERNAHTGRLLMNFKIGSRYLHQGYAPRKYYELLDKLTSVTDVLFRKTELKRQNKSRCTHEYPRCKTNAICNESRALGTSQLSSWVLRCGTPYDNVKTYGRLQLPQMCI